MKMLTFPVDNALLVRRRCTALGSTRVTPTGLDVHAASKRTISEMTLSRPRRSTLEYYVDSATFDQEASMSRRFRRSAT